MPVDAAVKAEVGLRVVDPDRAAALQRGAGDAAIGGEAQSDEPRRDLGLLLGHVREIQLILLRIEEQHGHSLGVERLAALRGDERQQVLELDVRGKGAAEIVEEPQARGIGSFCHCGRDR